MTSQKPVKDWRFGCISDLIYLFCQKLIMSYLDSDNSLQLDAQVCLQGKKKSPGKRIAGFQVVELYVFVV